MSEQKEQFARILENLIEFTKDKDYKKSIPIQAKEMGIPYQTLTKYINATSECSASNLVKIARYYNVSVDYLLGLTKNPTVDKELDAVSKYIGLSDTAVLALSGLNAKRSSRAYIDLLSCIIADKNFEYLLGLLEGYIVPEEEYLSVGFSMSGAKINKKELSLFAATDALRMILNDASSIFLNNYLTTEERLDIIMQKKEERKNANN